MSVGVLSVSVSDRSLSPLKRAKIVSNSLLPMFFGTGESDPRRVAFCDLLRIFSKDYVRYVQSLMIVLLPVAEQSVYPDYTETMLIINRLVEVKPANDRFGKARVLVDGLRRVYDAGNLEGLLTCFRFWQPDLTLDDLSLLLRDLFRVFYIHFAFAS